MLASVEYLGLHSFSDFTDYSHFCNVACLAVTSRLNVALFRDFVIAT